MSELHDGRPRFRDWAIDLRITWILLLLIGVFPILAPLADLAGVAKTGIPSDHGAAFASLAGMPWDSAKAAAPGLARYVSVLEVGYALHELVFGLFFLVLVVIPLRQGARWAWFSCWAVLIADLGYTVTFGRYDSTLLRQSLIADIATPVLLLAQARRFFHP